MPKTINHRIESKKIPDNKNLEINHARLRIHNLLPKNRWITTVTLSVLLNLMALGIISKSDILNETEDNRGEIFEVLIQEEEDENMDIKEDKPKKDKINEDGDIDLRVDSYGDRTLVGEFLRRYEKERNELSYHKFFNDYANSYTNFNPLNGITEELEDENGCSILYKYTWTVNKRGEIEFKRFLIHKNLKKYRTRITKILKSMSKNINKKFISPNIIGIDNIEKETLVGTGDEENECEWLYDIPHSEFIEIDIK